MRTALVRVDVDPTGALTQTELGVGLRDLADRADANGLRLMEGDGRHVQVLVAGESAESARATVEELVRAVLGTEPAAGVVTLVSRGTDDDAHGVLAGFGLSGRITRTESTEGWDVVRVELARADLERVPESRVRTALEAALHCEVVLVPV